LLDPDRIRQNNRIPFLQEDRTGRRQASYKTELNIIPGDSHGTQEGDKRPGYLRMVCAARVSRKGQRPLGIFVWVVKRHPFRVPIILAPYWDAGISG
jgi:hypothetical protein